MRIGVIGAGSMGGILARHLAARVEVGQECRAQALALFERVLHVLAINGDAHHLGSGGLELV